MKRQKDLVIITLTTKPSFELDCSVALVASDLFNEYTVHVTDHGVTREAKTLPQ